jgi:hypothetical protein
VLVRVQAHELEAGQPGSVAGRAVGVGAVDQGLRPVLALSSSVARTLALVPVHLVERAAAAPAPSRVPTQALARSARQAVDQTPCHAQLRFRFTTTTIDAARKNGLALR